VVRAVSPNVQLIATNSTTEALQQLEHDSTISAIASLRASQLYNLPILASGINDYPDNCTRFWVLAQSQPQIKGASHTTLAFSVRANVPGALVKPLQVFAQRGINLSASSHVPSKRSLGDYLFFIDLEADANSALVQSALAELAAYTEILNYSAAIMF
jgi:prephenate dehydratase